MSEKPIDEIKKLPFADNMDQSIKGLLGILSKDWIKGLTALKRSRILINNYVKNEVGKQISEIIISCKCSRSWRARSHTVSAQFVGHE